MITLGAIILGIKAQSKEPTVQILFPKFYKDIATIEDKSKFALGMAIFFLHGLI